MTREDVQVRRAARAVLFAKAKAAKVRWSGHGHTTQWWVNLAVELKAELIAAEEVANNIRIAGPSVLGGSICARVGHPRHWE